MSITNGYTTSSKTTSPHEFAPLEHLTEEEDQTSLFPENHTLKTQVLSFPMLKNVPTTWSTMLEDLNDYFWKNCSYGPKKYGFPKAQECEFKQSMVKFTQKTNLDQHGTSGFDVSKLPTYRRHFRAKISGVNQVGWLELGSQGNLEFYPPSYAAEDGQVNSDFDIFKGMSTDDLVEFHWNELCREEEDDFGGDSSDSEEEDTEEDLSEIDCEKVVDIPERIPRLRMDFRRCGASISYETSRPRARNHKSDDAWSTFAKIIIFLYAFIVSLFKKEEKPKKPRKKQPNPILEVTVSNIPRDSITCKLLKQWSLDFQQIICWGGIFFNTGDRPIVISCSDGKNKRKTFDATIQNVEPIHLDVKVNFPLEKLYISRDGQPCIQFKVEGRTGKQVHVKFKTELGDLIFDKTVVSRAISGKMVCKVVRSTIVQSRDSDVDHTTSNISNNQPRKHQKTWLDDLPKELASELKPDSKFIEIFLKNPLDMLNVTCSCISDQNQAITLKIPNKNQLSYKIQDPLKTTTKTMTYSYGKYILEDSKTSTTDLNITLRNLTTDDFKYSWERQSTPSSIPANVLTFKSKENPQKIKVLFKDELGNYQIDDLSSPLPLDGQDPRKKLIVNLKNALYKTSGSFSLTKESPYVLTCQINHTLYDIIEPVRVTITDGQTSKEFFMVDEENEVGGNACVMWMEMELRNGLTMSDISYSAVTTRINNANASTLKITFLPKVRPPIVVDVVDKQGSDRYVIEKSQSHVNVDVLKGFKDKTLFVLMKDGLSLQKVKFLAVKPLKVDGVWRSDFIFSISAETTDDLVVWLVGNKEIKKMTVFRQEAKHFVHEEVLEKPEKVLEIDSAQGNLVIFLKKIPLANVDVTIKQFDKNSLRDTVILSVFTKEKVPIRMITEDEYQHPKEHVLFNQQPPIPFVEVRIIKGLFLRDLDISTVKAENRRQEFVITVQNPGGHWLAMTINNHKEILKINSDEEDEGMKEIRLIISDDLMGRIISHRWEKPTVLEEPMIFKITFDYCGKIDVNSYPAVFNVEDRLDAQRLEEQNLKVVEKLSKLQDFEEEVLTDVKEEIGDVRENIPDDDSGIDLYDRYFKKDADFYRRLYAIFEGWKHRPTTRDAAEDHTSREVVLPKKYQRGLPMVGFLKPLLTFSSRAWQTYALPYQRCDLTYARYLGHYYKYVGPHHDVEYLDYSSGEEENLEENEEDQKKNEDGQVMPAEDMKNASETVFVPSIYPNRLEEYAV